MPKKKVARKKKKQATPDTAQLTSFVKELDAALKKKDETEKLAAVKKVFSSLPEGLNISLEIDDKETSLKSIQFFLNQIDETPTPKQKKTFKKYVDNLPRFIDGISYGYGIKPEELEANQEESAASPPPPVAAASTPNTTDSVAFEQKIAEFLGDAHTNGMKFSPENAAKIQKINEEIKKFHENPYAFIDSNTAVSAEEMELRISSMKAIIREYQEFLKWQDPAQSIASLNKSIADLKQKLSGLDTPTSWRGRLENLTNINLTRQKVFIQEQIKLQEETLRYYEADQEVLKSLQATGIGQHSIMMQYNSDAYSSQVKERYKKALEKYYNFERTTGQFIPHEIPADGGTKSPAPPPSFTELQAPQADSQSILSQSAAKRMKLYELYQQEKPSGKTVKEYADELNSIDLDNPDVKTRLSPERIKSIREYKSLPGSAQKFATIYSPPDNPIAKVTYHTSVNGKTERLELANFGKDHAYELNAENSVTEVDYANGAKLFINSDGSVNLGRIEENPNPEASEDEFARYIVHQFENTEIPNPTINLANIGLYDTENPAIAKARILSKIVHFYAVDENGKVDKDKYNKIQGAILTGNSVEIQEVFVKPELSFLRGVDDLKSHPDYNGYNPLTYFSPLDPHFKKARDFSIRKSAFKSVQESVRESQDSLSGVSRYNPSLVNPIKEQMLQNKINQKESKDTWDRLMNLILPATNPIYDSFDSRQKQKVKESLEIISQVSPAVYNEASDLTKKTTELKGMARQVRDIILEIKTTLKLDDKATVAFLDRLREDTRQDVKYSPGSGGGRH